MTTEKFIPKHDSFEKINYARQLIVRGDHTTSLGTIVDQILGSGANQWFLSERDERIAKKKRVDEHDEVLRVTQLLMEKYGNDL